MIYIPCDIAHGGAPGFVLVVVDVVNRCVLAKDVADGLHVLVPAIRAQLFCWQALQRIGILAHPKAGQHFACVADYCGLGGIYGEGVGGHGAELKKAAVGGLVWGW